MAKGFDKEMQDALRADAEKLSALTGEDHSVEFYDDDEDEYDLGDECGRWDNGRLGRSCSLAGTEFCDFECPYR